MIHMMLCMRTRRRRDGSGARGMPDIVLMRSTPGQSVLAPARIPLVPEKPSGATRVRSAPAWVATSALGLRIHSRFNMPHMSDAAIDVTDVHKTYKGRVHALRGVTMRVERGEVFGLLGPNGAGK